MANKLQIKRGAEENLPTLAAGELAMTTDTFKFYFGDGTNNHLVPAIDLLSNGTIPYLSSNAQLVNSPITYDGTNVNVGAPLLVNGTGAFTGTVSGADATASNQFVTLGQITTGTSGLWYRDTTNGYTILTNSNDKVGIGTSKPEVPLHIFTTNRNATIYLDYYTHDSWYLSSQHDANFHLGISGGNYSGDKLIINYIGNIGINQTNPTERLHVVGNIYAESGVLKVNTSGQTTTISNYHGANSNGYNIWIGGGGQNSVGDADYAYYGSYNIGIGLNAGYKLTTGNKSVLIGIYTGYNLTTAQHITFSGYKTGNNLTIGYRNSFYGSLSGYYSVDDYYTDLFGFYTFYYPQHIYKTSSFGSYSGVFSLDSNNVANFGFMAGYYNTGNYNTNLGASAQAIFLDDTSRAVEINTSDNTLDPSTNQITFANGHGFTGSFVTLRVTTTDTVPTGWTANGIYPFRIIDANTLQCYSGFSDTGSGTHTLTPNKIINYSTAIGYGAYADASYQMVLGNSSLQEVKTYANLSVLGTDTSYFAGNLQIGNQFIYGKAADGRNYLSFLSAGNEITIGGSTSMFINYRAAYGDTPTLWIWQAGSSTSWADFKLGRLYINTIADATGDFLTIDSNNLINKRTAAEVIGDLGLDGKYVNVTGDIMTGNLTVPQLISNIPTGTAPLQVASTTMVANLNAQYLGGHDSSYYGINEGRRTFGYDGSYLYQWTKIATAYLNISDGYSYIVRVEIRNIGQRTHSQYRSYLKGSIWYDYVDGKYTGYSIIESNLNTTPTDAQLGYVVVDDTQDIRKIDVYVRYNRYTDMKAITVTNASTMGVVINYTDTTHTSTEPTGIVYIDNYIDWHSGNDGAGSGLDADKWDGYQFADYLNQGVRTGDSPTFAAINPTNLHTGKLPYYNGTSLVDSNLQTDGYKMFVNGYLTIDNDLTVNGDIIGNGNIFIGYTVDPTSGNRLAVNGNGYFNGDTLISGKMKSQSIYLRDSNGNLKWIIEMDTNGNLIFEGADGNNKAVLDQNGNISAAGEITAYNM